MVWRRPLLWITAGWICGMAIAAHWSYGWVAVGSGLAFVSGIALNGAGRRGAGAALLLAAVIAAGGCWFEGYEMNNLSSIPVADETEVAAELRGVIAAPPEIDGDRVVFDLYASAIAADAFAVSLPDERVKVYVRFKMEQEADVAREWKRGDGAVVSGELKRPLEATNFGAFDFRQYLRRQMTFWTVHAEGAGAVRIAEPDRRRYILASLSAVDRVREQMGGKIDALFAPPHSGFMKGLLLGVRDDLDPEQFQAFSQIGLTHILAISGLHVGIYVGAILWLLGKLPITRETRLTVALALVPLYVIVTGASPSVVRAGIMASIALYAARRNLLKDGLHILSAAALLMLAWNPFYLFNVSFQLSFAVTAGLIAGVPIMNQWLSFITKPALRSAVSVTIVAQLVSFPLTITYFNGFSLLSFPANFIMVPIFSFGVLPLGFITLVLSYIYFPAAAPVAAAAERLIAGCFLAVERMNAVDSAFTIWATPPAWWLAGYFAVLSVAAAAGAGKLRLPCRRRVVVVPSVIALAGLLVFAYAPNHFDRHATVAVIDVGQGDAIWIRTPFGKHLLIDGGGTLRFTKPGEEWRLRKDPYEVGKDLLVPLLKRRGVHRIDALFASHADTDHIGGLQAVLEQIPVKRMFFNGTVKPGATSEKLLRTAVVKEIPLIYAYRGMSIPIDRVTRIDVLYPPEQDRLAVEEDQNDNSLVFILTVYGRTFLFAGDIEAAGEKEIAAAFAGAAEPWPTGIDVMKIPHHGSKTSTTEEWLGTWKPKAAVISVGRSNVYGHPHPTVVERLTEHNILTYRTDLHGEIQFRVGVDAMDVRTMR